MMKKIKNWTILTVCMLFIVLAYMPTEVKAETVSGEVDGWKYEVLKDGTAKLVGFYDGDNIVIPSKIDGYKVTKFYTRLYSENQTEFVVPDSITTIGADTFVSCQKMKSIKMPKNLKVIHDYAFGAYSSKEGEWETTTKFTVKGYKNTAAEFFCSAKNIKFKSLGTSPMIKTPKVSVTNKNHKITLKWKKVKGATHYEVRTYNPKKKIYQVSATIYADKVKGSTIVYKKEGCTKGTKYKIQVRAKHYSETDEPFYDNSYASSIVSKTIVAK